MDKELNFLIYNTPDVDESIRAAVTDESKEHIGLVTWKDSPDGRILKSDVTIAKNYLNEKQIRQLERAVTGYFDYIEDYIGFR